METYNDLEIIFNIKTNDDVSQEMLYERYINLKNNYNLSRNMKSILDKLYETVKVKTARKEYFSWGPNATTPTCLRAAATTINLIKTAVLKKTINQQRNVEDLLGEVSLSSSEEVTIAKTSAPSSKRTQNIRAPYPASPSDQQPSSPYPASPARQSSSSPSSANLIVAIPGYSVNLRRCPNQRRCHCLRRRAKEAHPQTCRKGLSLQENK